MKMTYPTYQVLSLMAVRPGTEWYGYEIHRHTGLSRGAVQLILRRLEDRGLATSRWSDDTNPPEAVHGPPRQYFRLTEAGQAQARDYVQRFRRRHLILQEV